MESEHLCIIIIRVLPMNKSMRGFIYCNLTFPYDTTSIEYIHEYVLNAKKWVHTAEIVENLYWTTNHVHSTNCEWFFFNRCVIKIKCLYPSEKKNIIMQGMHCKYRKKHAGDEPAVPYRAMRLFMVRVVYSFFLLPCSSSYKRECSTLLVQFMHSALVLLSCLS